MVLKALAAKQFSRSFAWLAQCPRCVRNSLLSELVGEAVVLLHCTSLHQFSPDMDILGLVDVPLTLVLVLLALVSLYIYVTWTLDTWSSLGVPSPKPVPIFGNMLLAANKFPFLLCVGNDHSFYFGRDPVLVTTDKDILRELMVKQFNDFSSRYLQDYIDKSSRTLVSVLEDMANHRQDVDLKDVYSRFTMDVIAGTAFGLDTNLLKGHDREQQRMVKAMKGLMDNATGDNPAFLIGLSFPFLNPVLRWLGMTVFPKKHMDVFKACVQSLVSDREQEAEAAKMLALRKDSDGAGHISSVLHASDKQLTESEIIAQGIGVFTAGFETTASTLRFLTYSLATNPDVQDKLHKEITDVIGDGEVTYERLAEMKYLECVINETLRMYPPLPFISRKAADTVTIKGVTIPKGVGVMIPIFNITHDPDNYPDPLTFRPERFESDQDSFVSVLPFGFGPRHCIGMRLALLEIKVAAIH
ncbi:hypothetical protein BaRGS_00009495, partial [Batillaria attramentaria]